MLTTHLAASSNPIRTQPFVFAWMLRSISSHGLMDGNTKRHNLPEDAVQEAEAQVDQRRSQSFMRIIG